MEMIAKEGLRLRRAAPATDFGLTGMKVEAADPEEVAGGAPAEFVHIPECTQLGDTSLQVTLDGYQGYGDDARYVSYAATNFEDLAADYLDLLAAARVALETPGMIRGRDALAAAVSKAEGCGR